MTTTPMTNNINLTVLADTCLDLAPLPVLPERNNETQLSSSKRNETHTPSESDFFERQRKRRTSASATVFSEQQHSIENDSKLSFAETDDNEVHEDSKSLNDDDLSFDTY